MDRLYKNGRSIARNGQPSWLSELLAHLCESKARSQQVSNGRIDGNGRDGWWAVCLHGTDCCRRDVNTINGKYYFVTDAYLVAFQLARHVCPRPGAKALNGN